MINAVLITGCSYGLGNALALKFSKYNCHVYAVGRNRSLLEKLAEKSSNIKPIIADITTKNGRLKIQELMNSEKKSISIIHNAAILEPRIFKLSNEALLREHAETNYLAPLFITHSLLPWIKQGQRILHISSAAANLQIDGLMSYCTTKAAMQFAIECLNVELNSDKIHCANLRPGMLDTPMALKQRSADPKHFPNQDYYLQLYKEKKLIDPEVAAEFVAWVMLKTKASDFSKNAWNIYESWHHRHWLPENMIISELS